MGCNNSSSQIANLSKELPNIYLEVVYGGSCGWIKTIYRLLKQLKPTIQDIPIDCKLADK